MLSAKLAAGETLDLLAGAKDDLAGYDRDLRRALSSQLAAAWGAKVALDRFPRLTYAAVRSPYVWKAVVALIGGEVPSPSAMRGPAPGLAPHRRGDRARGRRPRPRLPHRDLASGA